MISTKKINPAEFREKLPEFEEKTREFYDGKINVKDYKGFSGKYGSYAQRGGKANMLRLRMSGGRITRPKREFILDQAKKHDVNLLHYTTCQAVQMHNLQPEAVFDIMDKALDVDIVCYGGGGDYPRNVMCSPLAGVDPNEYFDVMPYALATADFLMQFIDAEKMPRKLKVAFSGSKENVPHATFRDLGFVARENGNFDVYAAGGLGGNPRFGVLVDEDVNPKDIFYDVVAMIQTFRKHGNYDNRAKARTRYMVEALGSEEAFREAFQEELKDVKANLSLDLTDVPNLETDKQGDGTEIEESFQVRKQKQPGLYAVNWHPVGGSPDLKVFEEVSDYMNTLKDVEMRISPDESVWIINLTGSEAKKVLEILKENNAASEFETSIACIGASICQVGLRDSQAALKGALEAVKAAGLPDNALPQVHISGCPSSCGTHQVGKIGFRGFLKVIDKKPHPAFILFVNGNDLEGEEKLGHEVGTILQEKLPDYLVKVGQAVAAEGKSFDEWMKDHPEGLDELAAEFLV